jgi:hypothetical protein
MGVKGDEGRNGGLAMLDALQEPLADACVALRCLGLLPTFTSEVRTFLLAIFSSSNFDLSFPGDLLMMYFILVRYFLEGIFYDVGYNS